MLRALIEDARYALRLFGRQPGFAFSAVLLLALGIGANSAIFSLVDSVLLRPMPYKDLDSLHYLRTKDTTRGRPVAAVSVADFADIERQAESFAGIGGILHQPVAVNRPSATTRVAAAFASRRYFETLGIGMMLGRSFLPEEYEPKRNQAVILTEGLWRQQFGGDARVIGSTVSLEGEVHVIAGVLPDLKGELRSVELYLPLPYTAELMAAREARLMTVVAKLKPGVSTAQANEELVSVSRRLAETHPATNAGMVAFLTPLMDEVRSGAAQPLAVLAVAVGLVLLIACANLASLLLVRMAGRRKEIAIRSALGASQARIVRQMMTESVLLALAGGAAGLVLAWWLIGAVKQWGTLSLPRLSGASLSPNVLGFTFVLALASGALFGAVPAWHVLKLSLASTLGEESRGGSGGPRGSLTRSLLVVSEVALSAILLVSAGLLLRTYAGLTSTDVGFRPEGVLTMRTLLPETRYAGDEARVAYVRNTLDRLASMPGVESAGGAALMPLMGNNWPVEFSVAGSNAPSEPVSYNSITPRYFDTIRARLVSGRDFSQRDSANSPPVVIVSESLERRHFPGRSAIGQHVSFRVMNQTTTAEVVGVVGDIAQRKPGEPPRPTLYQPHAQRPWPFIMFTLRAAADPAAMVAAVNRVVHEIDPETPVDRVEPLQYYMNRVLGQQQLAMVLLTAFAALAVLLSAVGLYGVLAVAVAQRGREIGIRMALGATAAEVARLILRQGMGLTAAGLAAGLATAPLATYAFKQMLYGVKPLDAPTFASVAVLILAISAVACAAPAFRAARVDPASALRD